MMEWINSDQGIKILQFLVLLMALVWLLSGGFRFGGRRKKKKGREQ